MPKGDYPSHSTSDKGIKEDSGAKVGNPPPMKMPKPSQPAR